MQLKIKNVKNRGEKHKNNNKLKKKKHKKSMWK